MHTRMTANRAEHNAASCSADHTYTYHHRPRSCGRCLWRHVSQPADTGIVKSILSIGTLIVFLMAHEWMRRPDTAIKQGEFYILTLSTLLGMYFMISAGHFLMFFIGLETASIRHLDGSPGCLRSFPHPGRRRTKVPLSVVTAYLSVISKGSAALY